MPFAWYRPITVPAKSVAAVNFPMMFWGPYTWLRSVAYGGHVQTTTGVDIAFYADIAATILLPFERVAYDQTTGACEFHVQVPTISTSVATTIYIMYGDSGATDLSNKHAVWDSNYVAVYHFGDGVSLDCSDSTAYANHGTSYGASPTTGLIGSGGAVSFGGIPKHPPNPTLSYVPGGSLPATTYWVQTTYTNSTGVSTPSAEVAINVPAGNLLSIAAPPTSFQAANWSAYVSTSSGTETKQNTAPLAFGAAWTEPTSGLVAGTAVPKVNVNTSASGYVYVPPSPSLNVHAPITVEWHITDPTAIGPLLSKRDTGTLHGYECSVTDYSFITPSGGNSTIFWWGDNQNCPFAYGNGAPNGSTYRQWDTYDGTNAHTYIGGDLEVFRSPSPWGANAISDNLTTPLCLGSFPVAAGAPPQSPWPGVMDELRISNITRSNDWNLLTSASLEDGNHTFYTVGPEQVLFLPQPRVYVIT